jgi:hypothetical protein
MKRTVYVVDKDGKFYVEMRAVLSSLSAMIDGLPMTFFGKARDGHGKAYMTVDAAIEWCETEVKRFGPDEKVEKRKQALLHARSEFLAGRTVDAK